MFSWDVWGKFFFRRGYDTLCICIDTKPTCKDNGLITSSCFIDMHFLLLHARMFVFIFIIYRHNIGATYSLFCISQAAHELTRRSVPNRSSPARPLTLRTSP